MYAVHTVTLPVLAASLLRDKSLYPAPVAGSSPLLVRNGLGPGFFFFFFFRAADLPEALP